MAVSSTQIDLSWTDVAGENGYRVYQWQGSGVLIASLPAGSTGYSVSLLSPGTSYWFSVEAFNSAGSRYTPWTSTTTQTASPPARAGDFSTEAVSDEQIDLLWDDVNGEEGYRVYQWQGSGVLIATLPADSTGYSVSSLSPDTGYWFSVEAFNSAGSSFTHWTAGRTLDTPPPTSRPTSPEPLSLAEAAADRLELTWTNASFEVGYRLYQWGGSGSVLIGSFGTDVTSHSIRGLRPETTYWFTVEAFNSLGSRYSAWTQFSTLQVALFEPETSPSPQLDLESKDGETAAGQQVAKVTNAEKEEKNTAERSGHWSGGADSSINIG